MPENAIQADVKEQDEVELSISPFQSFSLRRSTDKVVVHATIKKNGQPYFLSTSIKMSQDGSLTASQMDSRIETFTGKPVGSKANPNLEDALDEVRQHALDWANSNPSWWTPEPSLIRPRMRA